MSIIQKLWWFFKLEKRRYLVGIVALVLVSVLNLIPPMVMGRVIDAITSGQLTQQDLLLSLFYLLLAAFGMYYLRYVWRMYILGTSYCLGQIMRSRLFKHFTKMSSAFYQTYRTGDLMAHATNDINALTRLAGGGVMSAVDASITALVTLLTMLFSISWQMTLVAILPLPFMAYTTSRLGRKTHKAFGESQAAFSELNNKVQESVSGIKVTKSFGYQADELKSFQAVNELTFQKNLQTMKYDSLFDPLIEVTQNFSTLQTSMVSAGRVFALIDERTYEPLQENGQAKVKEGNIRFEHVCFSYDGKHPILDDISFSVNKGETIAFVGHTGSGKSSIINVLMRFYEFQSGRVLLDDVDIRDFSQEELRKNIGLVLQEPFLYHGTIKSNIAMYQEISDDQVQAAAAFVDADSFIQELPQGYDSPVSERGSSFSTGQCQLLAFARTVASQPKILILDEATANIDSETESLVQASLAKMRQGRTTIAIAHRLSTIQDANCIYVLDKGRIIESGTHEELLALGGTYHKMYSLQAGAMADTL